MIPVVQVQYCKYHTNRVRSPMLTREPTIIVAPPLPSIRQGLRTRGTSVPIRKIDSFRATHLIMPYASHDRCILSPSYNVIPSYSPPLPLLLYLTLFFNFNFTLPKSTLPVSSSLLSSSAIPVTLPPNKELFHKTLGIAHQHSPVHNPEPRSAAAAAIKSSTLQI